MKLFLLIVLIMLCGCVSAGTVNNEVFSDEEALETEKEIISDMGAISGNLTDIALII